MARLVVSVPKLGLSPKADDSRELYILAFASDLNIDSNSSAEIIGGANKNLPELASGVASKASLKFLLASVSNIFPVSRSFPHASLSGSGIILYPNLDPKGFFALQMFVIESDDNHRSFGEKLDSVLGDKEVEGAASKLAGAVTTPLIGNLMGAVASTVPALFKGSKDDLLMSHAHSGFDFDNYGVPDGDTMADFPFGSKLVEGVLRFRINP